MEQIMDQASNTEQEKFERFQRLKEIFLFYIKYIKDDCIISQESYAMRAEFVLIKMTNPGIFGDHDKDYQKYLTNATKCLTKHNKQCLTKYAEQFCDEYTGLAESLSQKLGSIPPEDRFQNEKDSIEFCKRMLSLAGSKGHHRSENPVPDSSIKTSTANGKGNLKPHYKQPRPKQPIHCTIL